MISGAGITDVNGLYEIQSSTINGAPFWANTQTGYQIYLSATVDGTWLIEDGGQGGFGSVYETNEINLSSPLNGSWIESSGGSPPIPILGTAYDVTVSGATPSGVNGTYSYLNTSLGYPVYINGFYTIYKSIDVGSGKWRIDNETTTIYETTQTTLVNPWQGTWVAVP